MRTPFRPDCGVLRSQGLPGLLALVLLAPVAHAQTELAPAAVPAAPALLAGVAIYPNPAHIRATV